MSDIKQLAENLRRYNDWRRNNDENVVLDHTKWIHGGPWQSPAGKGTAALRW